MNYLFFASLYFLAGVFVSCQSNRSGPPALIQEQYTYKGANRCDSATNSGINLAVSYVLMALMKRVELMIRSAPLTNGWQCTELAG